MKKKRRVIGFADLDDRDLYFVDCVSTGMSISHIASDLQLKADFCSRHLWRLYEMLGVHSKDELVAAYKLWLNEEESENAGDHRKTA